MRLRSFFYAFSCCFVFVSISIHGCNAKITFVTIHCGTKSYSVNHFSKQRLSVQTSARWKKRTVFPKKKKKKKTILFCRYGLALFIQQLDIRKKEIKLVRLFDKSQAHDNEHRTTRYTAITYCLFFHSMAQLLNALSTCTVHIIYSLIKK